MHWLLSTPDTFSLRNTIQRSGWLLYPPFHVYTLGTQLYRVEQLRTNDAVGITLYQTSAGLVLNTDTQLSGQEVEEASAKVWRILRLEEDIQPFLRLARHSEYLDATSRLGARLIRGATLFEDVLTATAATLTKHDALSWDLVAGLVDRLGNPLPSNPTLRAFPTPERVLRDAELLDGLLTPDSIDHMLHVARAFLEGGEDIEALVQGPWSANDLAAALTQTLDIEPDSMGLLMLSLGRYDYIPNDALAQRRMRRYGDAEGVARPEAADPEAAGPEAVSPEAAREFFSRWQPWGGLAYWLWDWARVPARASVTLPLQS